MAIISYQTFRSVFLLMTFAFIVNMSAVGLGFFINQYVFFRYSEQLGIPSSVKQEYHNLLSITANHPDVMNNGTIKSKTVTLVSGIGLTALVFGILSSLFIGQLSDRYGRRLTLGVILLGMSLAGCNTAMVTFFNLRVELLLLGSVLAGLIGGGAISMAMQLGVCLADLTLVGLPDAVTLTAVHTRQRKQERKRLLLMGLLDCAFALGSATGNSLMGVAIEEIGFIWSVLCLLGFYVLSVVILWILPDTESPPLTLASIRLPDPSSSSMPVDNGNVDSDDIQPLNLNQTSHSDGIRSFQVMSTIQLLRSHNPGTGIALFTLFLYILTITPEGQFVFLYLMSEPFCWSTKNVGLFNGLSSLLMACLSVVLTILTALSMRTKSLGMEREPLLSKESPSVDPVRCEEHLQRRKVLHSRMRMVIYIFFGFVMLMVSKLFMGVAFKFTAPLNEVLVYSALFFNLLRASVLPTLKSFLSSLHSATAQGKLFALIGLSEYVGGLIGLPGLPAVYAATVSVFPGAVFLLSAGLTGIAVLLNGVLVFTLARTIRNASSTHTVDITD